VNTEKFKKLKPIYLIMPTQEAVLTEIPAFHYKEFDIHTIRASEPLISNLGSGDPAYKLAEQSSSLLDRVAFYTVGMDLALRRGDAEALPEDVKRLGERVYGDAHGERVYGDVQVRPGRRVCHRDAVVFVPGSETPGTRYGQQGTVLADYHRDISGFDISPDGKILGVIPSSKTKIIRVRLPKGYGSLVAPTCDGILHPETGTPFYATEDREEALGLWKKWEGLSREQAIEHTSRFFRGRSGIVGVASGRGGGSGPLGTYICIDPREALPDLCSLGLDIVF
jgi:hypothetical protein